MTGEGHRLVEKYKDIIAARLRDVERRVADFSQELRAATGTAKSELPVRPVVVYEPVTRPDSSSREPWIVRFKSLRTESSRRAAADAYQQIEYRESDAVNQSVKCYGVVGVPRRLIHQAKRINRAKDELREAIAPVANRRIRIPGKDATGKRTVLVRELTTVILRQIQSSSVNLLAAYRELPIIDEPVDELSFMLTRTRSVPRQTVHWLRGKLGADPSPLAIADLDRLANLDANEYLVCPKAYYLRMRAHVFMRRLVHHPKKANERIRARRIISADLPILIPMTATTPDPIIIEPKPAATGRRHPPSRIEAEKTVESLHFYRMRPAYRRYA